MRPRPASLLALLGAALLAGGGCAGPSVSPPMSFYKAPSLDRGTVRRVVILPFRNESAFPGETREIERIFASELLKSRHFDLVPVPREVLLPLVARSVRLQGTYTLTDLAMLSEQYGADGVLVATVTEFRTYPPLLLGLKMELISTRTGEVMWSADGMFDADDPATRAALIDYHRRSVASSESLMNWEILLLSKSRFTRFACRKIVDTLGAAGSPAGARRMERLGDNERFSMFDEGASQGE